MEHKFFLEFSDHGFKCFDLFTYFCCVSMNISQKLFLQGMVWEILAHVYKYLISNCSVRHLEKLKWHWGCC